MTASDIICATVYTNMSVHMCVCANVYTSVMV